MTAYVLRRLAGFAATLLVAALVIFVLLDLLPGDPARFILGINASADAVAALRAQLGLDQPAPQRFMGWVLGMLRGDFGVSHTQGVPVTQLIVDRLAVTLPLALIAMVVSVAVGLPLGILAARRRGRATDTALMVLAQTGIAIPNFWFGMLLTLVFAVGLRWLPTGGFTSWSEDPVASLRALVLPGLALALPQAAILARVMRTALVDVIGQDFIRTARAKGVSEMRIVLRHALRNALIPVITVIGLQTGALVGGAVVTETVFGMPGLGRMVVEGIFERDFAAVQGAILVIVAGVLAVNLLTDLFYAALDRRIKL